MNGWISFMQVFYQQGCTMSVKKHHFSELIFLITSGKKRFVFLGKRGDIANGHKKGYKICILRTSVKGRLLVFVCGELGTPGGEQFL